MMNDLTGGFGGRKSSVTQSFQQTMDVFTDPCSTSKSRKNIIIDVKKMRSGSHSAKGRVSSLKPKKYCSPKLSKKKKRYRSKRVPTNITVDLKSLQTLNLRSP